METLSAEASKRFLGVGVRLAETAEDEEVNRPWLFPSTRTPETRIARGSPPDVVHAVLTKLGAQRAAVTLEIGVTLASQSTRGSPSSRATRH